MLRVIFIIFTILFGSIITGTTANTSELEKTIGVSIGSVYKFSMETTGNYSNQIHKFDLSQNDKYTFYIEIEEINDEGYGSLSYTENENDYISIDISLNQFSDPILYTDWDYWENHPTDIVYIKPPNETRIIENRDDEFYHKLDTYNNKSLIPGDILYTHYGHEDLYDKKTGIMKESSIVVEYLYRNGSHASKLLHFELISLQNNTNPLLFSFSFLTVLPIYIGYQLRKKLKQQCR